MERGTLHIRFDFSIFAAKMEKKWRNYIFFNYMCFAKFVPNSRKTRNICDISFKRARILLPNNPLMKWHFAIGTGAVMILKLFCPQP